LAPWSHAPETAHRRHRIERDEDEREQMGKISSAALRMGQLIDDLLAFSRTGRTAIHKREVSIGQLVQEAIAQLQPDLAQRNVVWNVLPLPDISGDRNLLAQVWVNLIGNAIKYSRPRDPAMIEIGAVIQDKEIIFHIRDNGVGFNMEHADKLFGVFQRLHDASEFEGTGIGLANVRRIVQRHNGRTWAESRQGEGATFYFSIPAA